MAEGEDVRLGVRRFILETFLVGEPPESLRDSTSLLLSGIVSSLAMLELVSFVEQQYAVTLRQTDMAPERLDSVDRITALVEERRSSV